MWESKQKEQRPRKEKFRIGFWISAMQSDIAVHACVCVCVCDGV